MRLALWVTIVVGLVVVGCSSSPPSEEAVDAGLPSTTAPSGGAGEGSDADQADSDRAQAERDIVGCALGVAPMVSKVSASAEAAQMDLLANATTAAQALPEGPSRSLAMNSLSDIERSIDQQVRFYAEYPELVCRADPHFAPDCTRGAIDVVGDQVGRANRDLPLYGELVDSMDLELPQDFAVQADHTQAMQILSGRVAADSQLVATLGDCVNPASGRAP